MMSLFPSFSCEIKPEGSGHGQWTPQRCCDPRGAKVKIHRLPASKAQAAPEKRCQVFFRNPKDACDASKVQQNHGNHLGVQGIVMHNIYIYMWISWTIVFCWDNWNWKPWMCMAFHMNFVGVSGDRNPNRSPIHWKSLIIGHFRGYPSDKLRDDNVSNKLWNFQHQTIWLVVKPPLWKILVNWDD